MCQQRECVPAHRHVLARTGAMLLEASLPTEPLQQHCYLEEFAAPVVRLALTYLYTGCVTVHTRDLAAFSRLVDTLLLSSLQVVLAS